MKIWGITALDPSYVLTAFMVAGSDLTGMYYQLMWALGQSCIPAFYYSLCTLHVYECNQLNQFLFSVLVKTVFKF